MFFSILTLAISSSIDSLGIGITYGLKRIELKKWTRLILFFVSILVTILSIISGNILKNIFSENFFKLIGTVILVLMGLLIVFKTDCEDQTFDLDNSNDIDIKEALILGIALSLDNFCIGIGAISLGINMFIFALAIAFLQFAFLSIGNFLGIHLSNFNKVPQSIWTKISGVLLILIGLFKL